MTINPATSKDASAIALLADEIWSEHYTPLIGKEQVEYMLQTIQSECAIKEQIESGKLCYTLLLLNDNICGYLAFRDEGDGKFFLSKLYIKREFRGNGAVKSALAYLKEYGAKTVYLTVNRGNTASIESYKNSGFQIAREEDADIGGGFVMNDYVMEIEI